MFVWQKRRLICRVYAEGGWQTIVKGLPCLQVFGDTKLGERVGWKGGVHILETADYLHLKLLDENTLYFIFTRCWVSF